MSTETDTKRIMTDDEITNFINEVSTKRLKTVQESFNTDDIISIGYNASQLTQCIIKIMDYPTKYQIDQFKDVSTDKRLLSLLQSPEVSLGLELKSEYDSGKLDCFDKIIEYQMSNGLTIEDDTYITNFMEQAKFFLPDLPEITHETYRRYVLSNEHISNLVWLGKTYYENFVSDLVMHRFADLDLKEIVTFATNHKVINYWSRLYELPVDDKIPPYEVFYAYIGALSLLVPRVKYEWKIREWLSILLEPILIQFESTSTSHVNAKDELRSKLLNHVEFKNIFTSTHPEPIYIVQIIAGGEILLGSSSAPSLAEAEAKASGCALYNKLLFDSAIEFVKNLANNNNEQKNGGASYISESPYINTDTPLYSGATNGDINAGMNSQPSYSNAYHTGGQPSVHHPITPEVMHPSIGGAGGGPGVSLGHVGTGISGPLYSESAEPSKSVVQTNYNSHLKRDAAAQYPNGLINEHYQRQLQELTDQILEAPRVDDEASIDSSSKEKLNQLLIKKRIAPAEYKTAKLNNSDVQVTCFIENFPIAKATSTNKKKAGQICAQYILNYPEYFLQRFSNR